MSVALPCQLGTAALPLSTVTTVPVTKGSPSVIHQALARPPRRGDQAGRLGGGSHGIQRFRNLMGISLINAHSLKKPKKLYLLVLEKEHMLSSP